MVTIFQIFKIQDSKKYELISIFTSIHYDVDNLIYAFCISTDFCVFLYILLILKLFTLNSNNDYQKLINKEIVYNMENNGEESELEENKHIQEIPHFSGKVNFVNSYEESELEENKHINNPSIENNYEEPEPEENRHVQESNYIYKIRQLFTNLLNLILLTISFAFGPAIIDIRENIDGVFDGLKSFLEASFRECTIIIYYNIIVLVSCLIFSFLYIEREDIEELFTKINGRDSIIIDFVKEKSLCFRANEVILKKLLGNYGTFMKSNKDKINYLNTTIWKKFVFQKDHIFIIAFIILVYLSVTSIIYNIIQLIDYKTFYFEFFLVLFIKLYNIMKTADDPNL